MSTRSVDGVDVVLGGKETPPYEIDRNNPFEVDLEKTFKDKLFSNNALSASLWSSLANVVWTNKEKGQSIGYSFRAAGDLIANLRGEGTYLDHYCSGPSGVVDSEIAEALAPLGWTFEISATGGIKRGDY